MSTYIAEKLTLPGPHLSCTVTHTIPFSFHNIMAIVVNSQAPNCSCPPRLFLDQKFVWAWRFPEAHPGTVSGLPVLVLHDSILNVAIASVQSCYRPEKEPAVKEPSPLESEHGQPRRAKYEPYKPDLIWLDEAERDPEIKYRAFNQTLRELKKAEYTRKVNELADLAGCF